MGQRVVVALAVLITIPALACNDPMPASPEPASSDEAGTRRQHELDVLVEQTLVRPTLTAEPGFTAELLVPPGDLYDPLNIRPRDGDVLIDDDGAQEGIAGGRIWSVDHDGVASTLIETSRLTPVLGFDIAPEGFGELGGEIVVSVQPRATMTGAFDNHLIRHVDPNSDDPLETLCTLPTHGNTSRSFGPLGSAPPGVPGAGITAQFGPPGSPFANRFFAVAMTNNTVYEVTADGECTPFVTFAEASGPTGIGFSVNGSRMLASVGRAGDSPGARGGVILSVAPDGAIDSAPVVVLPGEGVSGLAVAPSTFGPYAEQLFFASGAGPGRGKVYRLAPDGEVHLVVTGFNSPNDIAFVDNSLWVVDSNRDYIGGGFYLPDGFVVRIRLE